jgi:hypothetical protein
MNYRFRMSVVRLSGFDCVMVMMHFVQGHQAFAQAPKAQASPIVLEDAGAAGRNSRCIYPY